MTFHKQKLTVLALGVSLLSLGACGSFTHPNAMPSGYTYHHETYKSPAPAESSKVTIEQRQYMDATQAQQFRDAVYDLLERLTMRAGMPPKPVYVLAPDTMTTFYSNIDNDLRESMRHIGYAISDTPQDAYIFTYEALPLTKKVDPNASMANNVQLTLRIFSDLSASANQLTEETGRYFIQGAEALEIQPSRYSILLPQQVFSTGDVVDPLRGVPVVPEMIAPSPVVMEPVVAPSVVREPIVAPALSRNSVIEPSRAPASIVQPAPVVNPPMEKVLETVSPAPRVSPSPVPALVQEPITPPVMRDVVVPVPPAQVVKPPMARIPAPVIEPITPPSPMMEPRQTLSKPASKAPSRNDIVIINRGDKPAMAVEIPEPPAPKRDFRKVAEPAMTTTNNVIQRRTSNPADY